jgi:alanyl-tRNA synthetase
MENHPVYATFPDGAELENISYRSKLELEGDIRLVNVGEGGKIDICACCAPHVLTTGQIGVFVIVDAYHYKGGTRIHMLVSDRALERIRSERECVRALSRMLSVKPLCDEVLSGVERLGKENSELKNAVNEGKTALAEAISSHAQSGEGFFKIISEADADLLRKIAIGAREKNATTVAVFGGGDGSYRFVICGDDAQTLLTKIKALGGKGGGKDVICGSVSCTEDAIAELMK